MKNFLVVVSLALFISGCFGEKPSPSICRRLIQGVESVAQRGEYVDSVHVGNVYSGNKKIGRTRIYGGNRCDVEFTLHSGDKSTRFVAVFGWHTQDASDIRLVEVKEY